LSFICSDDKQSAEFNRSELRYWKKLRNFDGLKLQLAGKSLWPMKTEHTLRVHNALVADRMRGRLNRLLTGRKLGRIPGLDAHEDRNELAFHYIESGAIRRFSARHRIIDNWGAHARKRPHPGAQKRKRFC